MTYEDPQALGGLASALDIRQQNTAGVSSGMHAGICSVWMGTLLSVWCTYGSDASGLGGWGSLHVTVLAVN